MLRGRGGGHRSRSGFTKPVCKLGESIWLFSPTRERCAGSMRTVGLTVAATLELGPLQWDHIWDIPCLESYSRSRTNRIILQAINHETRGCRTIERRQPTPGTR